MIEIRCPHCNKKLLDLADFQAPNSAIEIKCAKCKNIIVIKKPGFEYTTEIKEDEKDSRASYKPTDYKGG